MAPATGKDACDCAASCEDKRRCFPANREQGGGYIAEPPPPPGGRLAAEGKAILTLRHKSADELQLEQLPHRSSMPGPRQTSALMCPCTLSGAQNKCRKSSFLEVKRRRRAFLCLALACFPAGMGVKKRYAQEKQPRCLLSAICHLTSYQEG